LALARRKKGFCTATDKGNRNGSQGKPQRISKETQRETKGNRNGSQGKPQRLSRETATALKGNTILITK
jgi:hypothetical protein